MQKKQTAVIGLGHFGLSVANELQSMGHEVLVVDAEEKKIQDISDCFTYAVCANTTTDNTLKSLGLKDFDVVVVSIGQNIQANILTTMLLKEIGCRYVVVKASNPLHARVLEKIGADRVVAPEHDMGVRIAHSLISKSIVDYLELSIDYSIVEVSAPKEMWQKNFQDLQLRAKYGVNIIAIKKKDGTINISPASDDYITQEDILVAIGDNKALTKLKWL